MGSNTKKSKIWKVDLYKLLEVADSATEQEIKSAYRKKALKCHPDKNPDNPKAADLFMELSSALEILTDAKAREVYDRTRKAKEVNEARIKKLDSKRRKLREDLDRREKEAKETAEAARSSSTSFEGNSQAADEELLRKEIDRLKKEGSRALREEQEFLKQQILKQQQERVVPPTPPTSRPGPLPPQPATSSTSFADFEAMILGQLSDAAKAQKNSSADLLPNQ